MLWLTVFIDFSPPITMESFTFNHFTLLISLHLLFSLSILNLSVPAAAQSCEVLSCGEGTCKNSSGFLGLGYECECNPGWKKIQIGPLTFPSCVLPNCSVDLQCSNASSPAPSQPQLNECALVWCGKGTCVANATGYTCKCSQGAANLFNNPALACFDECSLGDDCKGLGLGLPMPNPPPVTPPPPPSPGTPPTPPRKSTADTGLGCEVLGCGEGTCKNSSGFLGLDYECECNPGWKKIQIGPLTFPSCVIPNCSVDFHCENASPPPPSLPQLSGNCAFVWCGKGTCVANATGHTCQCSQGAANLFNNPAWACLDECSLGADCNALGLGLPVPSPPAPPPNKSGSTAESGPVPPSNCARNLRALTMMLLATTILAWF